MNKRMRIRRTSSPALVVTLVVPVACFIMIIIMTTTTPCVAAAIEENDDSSRLLLLRDWFWNKEQQQQQQPQRHGTKRQALYQYSLDLHYQDVLDDVLMLQQQQQQQQSEDQNATKQQQQQQQLESIQNLYATYRQSIKPRQQQHYSSTESDDEDNETTPAKSSSEASFDASRSIPFADDDSIVPNDRSTSLHASFPPFPLSLKESNRALLQEMFTTSYDAYIYHAYYHDNGQAVGEVKPLTCQPHVFDLIKLPALTVIDALDTLLVMENRTEFARAVERLRLLNDKVQQQQQDNDNGGAGATTSLLDVDENVSLFETNIRILGGLLSAHQMALAFISNDHSKEKKKKRLAQPVLLDDVFMPSAVSGGEMVVRNGRLEHELWTQTGTCAANIGGTTSASTTAGDNHDVKDSDSSEDGTEESSLVPPTPPPTSSVEDICDSGSLSLQDCAIGTKTNDRIRAAAAAASNKKLNTTAATKRHKRRTLLLSRQQQQQQQQKDNENAQYWQYDGFLLDLAIDLGNRFLPAFDTKTGIPYGTINLRHGVPPGETTVASLAGAGSLSLEMELLSRLSGNPEYGRVAKRATRALWVRQYGSTGLVGKHVEIKSGAWTESLSGIGSNSDSFYEYLVKHYMLFGMEDAGGNRDGSGMADKDFWIMLLTAYTGIHKNLRVGEWYADGDMTMAQQAQSQKANSGTRRAILESLMAFYPGMQILLGQVVPAARTLNSFFLVRELLGFLPERFHFGHWRKDGGMGGAGKHPLRPELLESCYFLHRAIHEQQQQGSSSMSSSSSSSSSSSFSGWLWAADFALQKLEKTTRARCGYAGLDDVKPSTTGLVNSTEAQERGKIDYMNEMPSFFLSETIKYLYLTFDDDNVLHLDTDDRQWIFTTEAHPIHHAPAAGTTNNPSNGNRDKFGWDMDALKKLLQKRIHHGRNGASSSSRSIDSRRVATRRRQERSLSQELWSESTKFSDFNSKVTKIEELVTDMRRRDSNNNDDFVAENELESVVPQEHITMDAWKDSANHRNLAHVVWRSLGSGEGTYLHKACPNIYASEWLWIKALNGGSMDYADAYASVTNDNFARHPNGFVALGASEALGFHGSGVFLGQVETPGCSLRNQKADDDDASHGSGSSSSSSSQQEEQATDSTELKTELGTFQVAAAEGGSGFTVHHVESGQTIVATLLTDGDSLSESFVLVHSSSPTETGSSESVATTSPNAAASSSSTTAATSTGEQVFSSWWSQFLSTSVADLAGDTPTLDEQVRMADFEGNVFSCDVEIVAKKEAGLDDSNTEDVSSVVLARAPCTPALFGPSKVSKLAKSGDIIIEATIYLPSEEDLHGCNPPADRSRRPPPTQDSCSRFPWEPLNGQHEYVSSVRNAEEQTCPNRIVQFVHRGGCSFGTKAANQKKAVNAEAVVVINSEDEELFVMSGGAGDAGIADDSLPIAVLVAGLDGEELLRAALTSTEMKDDVESGNRNNDSHIVARVSLIRQDMTFDAMNTNSGSNGSDDNRLPSFPLVQANPTLLRVFARGGWGVQALRQIQDENTNWQVQLMRHEMDVSVK